MEAALFEPVQLIGDRDESGLLEITGATNVRGHDGLVARTQTPARPVPETPRDEPRDFPDADVVDRPDDVPPTKSPFGDNDE